MREIQLHWRKVVVVLAVSIISAAVGRAADPELTKEQQKEFLAKAKVLSSKHTKKGITDPYRLTMSDGTTTHEGVFQAIDDHKTSMQFADGHSEINFVDSYKYNIAAYILAEMIGMDDMIPVHIERKWNGKTGSLSWVIPVQFDEQERLKRKISAPNADTWNNQMFKIRVFDELVYDTDPNLTNVLIGDNWSLWRVDFSRAFRLSKDLLNNKNLVRCDRQLFDKLKALNAAEFIQRTKNFLTKPEAEAVMARRDKIVAYFQKLSTEKGEKEIFY